MKRRGLVRAVLAAFYAVAGYFHIAAPQPFLSIMPGWVPHAGSVVLWTGVAELVGAIALIQPFWQRLRTAAGIALALYAASVFPANINHFVLDMRRADGGFGLVYHVLRMLAQPLIIWLTLWSAELFDWPFRARS